MQYISHSHAALFYVGTHEADLSRAVLPLLSPEMMAQFTGQICGRKWQCSHARKTMAMSLPVTSDSAIATSP